MTAFMIISEGETYTHKNKQTNKRNKTKHFVYVMNTYNKFILYPTRDKCLIYVTQQFKYEKGTQFVKLFSGVVCSLSIICDLYLTWLTLF